ncbi:hypothetical protein HYX58_00810 [Candidatus Dependentiae bacterium]|nr:hypothetical protein [Candidatus Dependentiae bacterium]
MKLLFVIFLLFPFSIFSMEDPSLFVRKEMKEHYKNCLATIKFWRASKNSIKKNALQHLIASCYNQDYEIPEESREILIKHNILGESEKHAPELLVECVKEARKQVSMNKRLRIK